MKAREMKKLLDREYEGRIKQYKSRVTENKIVVEIAKAQIIEVEFIREMLFGIDETFDPNTMEVEVG